jgi:DNA-binding transcriptional ArsR family regulator
MPGDPNLATVASLIGEPTRASMLLELMSGRALTATELATRAEIAPSTASDHLARLVNGGLLACLAQGRHRYYRLASADVAQVLETLGVLAEPHRPHTRFQSELARHLRVARTCYDHLAGLLGVAMADALVARTLIEEADTSYRLTPDGEAWFTTFGVDLDATRRSRRAFARVCLDWTERRPHLAGSLGSALLIRLIEIGWLVRIDGERLLELTPAGQSGLLRELGLHVHDQDARRVS